MKTKDITKAIEQGKERGMKFLWWGGEHAFLVSFALLFLSLLGAAFIFAWSTLSSRQDVIPQRTEAAFEEELFEQILDRLQQKRERFEAAEDLEPRDLFFSD